MQFATMYTENQSVLFFITLYMKVLLIFFETKNRVYPRVDGVSGYIDRKYFFFFETDDRTYFRVNIINQGTDRERRKKMMKG